MWDTIELRVRAYKGIPGSFLFCFVFPCFFFFFLFSGNVYEWVINWSSCGTWSGGKPQSNTPFAANVISLDSNILIINPGHTLTVVMSFWTSTSEAVLEYSIMERLSRAPRDRPRHHAHSHARPTRRHKVLSAKERASTPNSTIGEEWKTAPGTGSLGDEVSFVHWCCRVPLLIRNITWWSYSRS